MSADLIPSAAHAVDRFTDGLNQLELFMALIMLAEAYIIYVLFHNLKDERNGRTQDYRDNTTVLNTVNGTLSRILDALARLA